MPLTSPYGYDFIKETTSTVGTGNYALGGAVTGFHAFSSRYANGDRFPYVAYDPGTGMYETGVGHYVSADNSIARERQGYTSETDFDLVNWPSGEKVVYVGTFGEYSFNNTQSGAFAGAAPLAASDNLAGYEMGSWWISIDATFGYRMWVCVDGTTGAAVWNEIQTQDGPRTKNGSNKAANRAVLVAGSVVVSNTRVTANSNIKLTSQIDGGTPGWLRVSARTPGTSFTITSSSGSDTSTVYWEINEPAA